LELLDVDNYDWIILQATAEVLRRDQEKRRREQEGDTDLPSL